VTSQAPRAQDHIDTGIHGLVEEEIDGRRHYFVDCVAGAKVIAAVPPITRERIARKS